MSLSRLARRLPVTCVRPGAAAPLAAVLLALALVPAVVAPETARAAASPVTYLLGAENSDGGFGAGPGQPSAALYSGWAALGLASAGHDLHRVAHRGGGLLAYIGSGPGMTSDVGSLERTILVVRAARLSARSFAGRDLLAALERRIRGNGSVSGQVNLTAFAMLALRAADVTPPARTYAWLRRQQDQDGGFSFTAAGGSSDIDDTGAVLEALAGHGAGARARAVAYLRHHQNRDGGFPQAPGGTSNAQSTAWALQGFDAAGVAASSVHRGGSPSPLAYLRSLIAADGHVRYARGLTQTPVWVTGEALMALEGKPLPLAPVVSPPAHAKPAPAPAPAPGGAGASSSSAGAGSASGNPASSAPTISSAQRPASPATATAAAKATPAAARPAVSAHGVASVADLAGATGFATALMLAPLGVG